MLDQQAAMLIESIVLARGGEDQRRHPSGERIEHRPQAAVHVDGADEHDVAIGVALAMIDGEQPGGLLIPQLQRVKRV